MCSTTWAGLQVPDVQSGSHLSRVREHLSNTTDWGHQRVDQDEAELSPDEAPQKSQQASSRARQNVDRADERFIHCVCLPIGLVSVDRVWWERV